MADDILGKLARLRGDIPPAPSMELTTIRSMEQPKPLNIPPPMPRPAQAESQPVAAEQRPFTRPASIKSSLDYFGEAAVDSLLGHRGEAISNSIALKSMAGSIRRRRGAFLGLAVVFLAGACSLAASPVCAWDNENCLKKYLGAIAGLCAAAGSALSASVFASRQSAGSIESIAGEWDQLAKTLHEALFLSPPSGEPASVHVRRWANQHRYISERTPAINPDRKKDALRQAMMRSQSV